MNWQQHSPTLKVKTYLWKLDNCQIKLFNQLIAFHDLLGGGPRVVVSPAAFHARVWGSVPGLGGLKETKNVSSPSTCES